MKNKSLPEKVQLSSVGPPGRCPVCGKTGISNVVSAPDRFHWRREVYQLKRCCSCSFVWLENPPKPNEMAFHYDAKYHSAVAAAGQGSAISPLAPGTEKLCVGTHVVVLSLISDVALVRSLVR